MTTETIYAYNDLNHQTVMISEGNLNMVGEWSSSGTYLAESKDTVDYGSALYLALVDNIGVNPTQAPRKGQQAKWSPLAVISQGTHFDDHTADQAYALGLQALDVANEALGIAVAGTNGIASTNDLAYTALQTAWSGTAGVNEAIQIAVTGTNAAQAAIATVATAAAAAQSSADAAQSTGNSAQSSANAAQSTADGAQSSANGARTVADAAFSIAVAGTNAAATAQSSANTAQSTGNAAQSSATDARAVADSAFSIAVAGTNAAAAAQSTGNIANGVANTALQTAWTGTSTSNANAHERVGFSFVIDGGGAVITSGFKGYVEVPFAMWLNQWTLVADQAGSCVVDVLKSNGYAGFPTAPSIADSDRPTLNNVQKNQNTNPSAWVRQLNAGDWIGFIVVGAGTVQSATVALSGTRS